MTKKTKAIGVPAPTQDTRPEPYDKEKIRIAQARERWVERTPPVEVKFPEEGKRVLKSPHNDDSGHLMRLGDTFGTRSADFLAIELTNLSAGVRTRGNREATEQETNAGIAFIAAVAPENELEAALAVQMAQNHALTTDLLGRAVGAENLEHMQAFGNLAVKLQRTFTAQIEALARMRGKGQQTVRVEHVTVEAGAQAIVGDVHHHAPRGGGAQLKSEAQPYGTNESQERPAMPSPDAQGFGLPISGDAERPVPHPRGSVSRRTSGKPKRIQTRQLECGDDRDPQATSDDASGVEGRAILDQGSVTLRQVTRTRARRGAGPGQSTAES